MVQPLVFEGQHLGTTWCFLCWSWLRIGFNKHTPWKINGWKPRMEVEDSDDLPDLEHFMTFFGVAVAAVKIFGGVLKQWWGGSCSPFRPLPSSTTSLFRKAFHHAGVLNAPDHICSISLRLVGWWVRMDPPFRGAKIYSLTESFQVPKHGGFLSCTLSGCFWGFPHFSAVSILLTWVSASIFLVPEMFGDLWYISEG